MTPLLLALHLALGTLVHQAPPPPPMLGDEAGDPADAADPPSDAPDTLDASDPADDERADEPAEDDELYSSSDDEHPVGERAPAADDVEDDDPALDDKRARHKQQRRKASGGGGVLPDDALDPLLVLPLQIALGVLLSNATAILWPIAPILVATAQVILGDLIGPNRGAVVPSAAAGYTGMLACGLTPPLVAAIVVGAAFGAVFFVPALASSTALIGSIGLALLYPSLLLALPAAHCGNSVFSSLAYFAMSEPKQPGDTGFRYPGVFAPSHKPEDERWEATGAALELSSATMAF